MFTLWLQIWGDTAMHVSDMRSWTWTCRRSTLDWQPMPSTIGASRVLACLFSRWHVSAFQRKGVAARSQGSQWTQPVNAPLAQTSPAPSRPPSVWHTCFPAWRAAHPPLPSVSSLIPHLAHFQHASSLFFCHCLFHFHLFITHTHPRPPFPLCLCGFLYCICRISRLSSPSPSFFPSSFCRMFV